jgi:hypothetical protein
MYMKNITNELSFRLITHTVWSLQCSENLFQLWTGYRQIGL